MHSDARRIRYEELAAGVVLARELVESDGAACVEAFVVSVKPWLLDFYVRKNGFAVVGAEPWPPFLEYQLILDCFFTQVRRVL